LIMQGFNLPIVCWLHVLMLLVMPEKSPSLLFGSCDATV
jgi:hypothetical protein